MVLSWASVTIIMVDSNPRRWECKDFPHTSVARSFQQEVVGNAEYSWEKALTPCRNDRVVWEIWVKNQETPGGIEVRARNEKVPRERADVKSVRRHSWRWRLAWSEHRMRVHVESAHKLGLPSHGLWADVTHSNRSIRVGADLLR